MNDPGDMRGIGLAFEFIFAIAGDALAALVLLITLIRRMIAPRIHDNRRGNRCRHARNHFADNDLLFAAAAVAIYFSHTLNLPVPGCCVASKERKLNHLEVIGKVRQP